MQSLYAFLILFSLVALIVGLWKPSTVLPHAIPRNRFMVCLIYGGLIFLRFAFLPIPPRPVKTAAPVPVAPVTKAETVKPAVPKPTLELAKVSWRKQYGIALVSFQIHSNLDVAAKDFEVSCIAQGASGTALHTYRKTLYETIKPHGVRIITGINFGFIDQQAQTLECRLDDWISAKAR